MKIFNTLVLIFCLGTSFAQDYQSIKSDQINYFSTNDLNYMLATRTDSFDVVDGDSIFYSYRTLRESSEDFCDFKISAPWYGEKVIIEEDGTNVFFNQDLDSIFIESTAALNDTFLIYTYPSGEWVKGTVSEISEVLILGSMDSVKTIELFSDLPDFEFATQQIRIGKMHGFISVLPFYSFPNLYETFVDLPGDSFLEPMSIVGSEYPRIGITKPLIGEMYHHEIGDELNYVKHVNFYADNTNESANVEIDYIDKTIWGTDSVEYTYTRKSKWSTIYHDNPELNSSGISSSEHTVKYYDLDEHVNPYLPEEFVFNSFEDEPGRGSAQWNTMSFAYCDRLNESPRTFGTLTYGSEEEPDLTSLCLVVSELGYSSYYEPYIVGVGNPDYRVGFVYDGWGQTHTAAVQWISNEDGDCGTNYSIGISEEEALIEISIFPNPANQLVNLQFPDNATIQNIAIYSADGKLVYVTDQFNSNTHQINCSAFDNGIYILKAIVDGHEVNKKVLIQR